MTVVLNKELAEAGASTGMVLAASHAQRERERWNEDALELFRAFAQTSVEPFMTEEVRAWAEKLGFDAPPDNRAWGHVARRASSLGVVEHKGYAKQRSSTCHGSIKTLWFTPYRSHR